jgi:hypothetical protein
MLTTVRLGQTVVSIVSEIYYSPINIIDYFKYIISVITKTPDTGRSIWTNLLAVGCESGGDYGYKRRSLPIDSKHHFSKHLWSRHCN